MCLLFVSISSSLCGESLRTTFGVGCGDELVPGREGQGLGSGGSETVHFPAGPQSVFAHQPGGAESLAQMTPKPGDLPKVTAPRVPPGWAAARLRLRRAFALHQDRRGDACGHLEEGRRLGANSDCEGEGCGGGVGGGGWWYLPWKPGTAPAWPVAATTTRTSGRREGRGRGADKAESSQVPGRLSCLGFPLGGRRGCGGIRNVRGPEVLASGSWAGAGWG